MNFDISLFVLPLAILIDIVFGDPPNKCHPVVLMGSVIRLTEKIAPKSGSLWQVVYGALMINSGIILFVFVVLGIELFFKPYPLIVLVINALLLKMALSINRLTKVSKDIELAVRKQDLEEARFLLSYHLVSRDTSQLDEGHICSATIESLSENLTDSVVAPLFYFLLGGVPLAWAYRFVNTADTMIGYHTPKYEFLGKYAARLDDVLNYIPSRLSAGLIIIAAPIIGGDCVGGIKTLLAQHSKTESPTAGWTMSSVAGVLRIILEKVSSYRLEGGNIFPGADHIRNTRLLIWLTSGIWIFLSFVFAWGVNYVV